MKKIVTSVLALLALLQVGAQTLDGSLRETYARFTSARNEGELMEAANRFALIAGHWSQEWAANYYAAYAKAYLSQQETDPQRRDALLDEADGFASRMNALNATSDESLVLSAYIAYARMIVDPSNRWKTYLGIFNTDLAKAKQANPDNPRIYYLEGIPLFFKPKAYGGGPGKAKPDFEKAQTLFARQDTTSILMPYWGASDNQQYLSKCN